MMAIESWPAAIAGDAIHVSGMAPGGAVALLAHPVPLNPGWRPDRYLTGLAPCGILLLRHEDGSQAHWYFDRFHRFVGNHLDALAEDDRGGLLETLACLTQAAWDRLVCAPSPGADVPDWTAAASLMSEHLARIRPLLTIPEQVTVCIDRPDELDRVAAVGAGTGTPPVSLPAILGLFQRDGLRDMVSAAGSGRLTLPSPIDGRMLSTDVGFCLRVETQSYRFRDDRHGLVFHVIAGTWRVAPQALYFPASGLLICRSSQSLGHLTGFLGGALVTEALLEHIVTHVTRLPAWLAAPSRRVTMNYQQDHLGHHLYNELGGLHAVAEAVPPASMPDLLLTAGPRTEMFGRADAIFPVLRGKIDRTPRDDRTLPLHIYETGRFLIRPTDQFVPRALARRISVLLEAEPAVAPHRAEYERLIEAGFTVVLLGLRTENRTVVDQTAFFQETIGVLADLLGPIAAVVDGHDARPDGQLFTSHGERIATETLIDAETGILRALQALNAGRADVRILSTIGLGMAETIFWCNRARLFVTPWGAGLAKYRWISNRPGLVVAGGFFQRNSPAEELHLYDSDGVMGGSTPMVVSAPTDARDDLEAPLLVPIDDPRRVNFRMRPGAIRARLIQTLAAAQYETPPASEPALPPADAANAPPPAVTAGTTAPRAT